MGLLRLRRLSLHGRGLLLLVVMAGGFLIHPVHGGSRGQHGGIVHGVVLLLVLLLVAGHCFGLRRHHLVSASGRRRIAVVDVHGLDSLRRRRRFRLLQLRLFVHWLLLMLLRARPVGRAALQLLVRL